jgi:formate hydrogenlyase subunit 6/NADH:ubiquinone oxidoreductase subunit I
VSTDPTTYRLRRENLLPFLHSFDGPLVGPVPLEEGEVAFRWGVAPEEMASGYLNSLISPVKFAFPQTQVLFRYDLMDGCRLEAPPPAGQVVFFGLRCCDVSAFRHLERFFGRAPADETVVQFIAGALLIHLTCQEPGPDCFCVCAGAGPFLKEGFDLQLTELEEEYFVEVGSPKGEAAVAERRQFFTPADGDLRARQQELWQAAEQKFRISTHFGTGVRKVTTRQVPNEIWQQLASRCLECGGCAYVCPLCTCFDVVDRRTGPAQGHRERGWDCCQYAGYSREVSLHNPRPDKISRFKRRFSHKLSYFQVEQDGHHGCVGCGRCVRACFGQVDLPMVVNALREGRPWPVHGRGVTQTVSLHDG